jgi:hypothetical protein
MGDHTEEGNIYKQIQDAISSLPENFSILEEQIDIELQMEYFKYSRAIKSDVNEEMISARRDELFDPNVPIIEKKELLAMMASVEKVDFFRAIEKYSQNPDPELKSWSILALQESRMVIQSSLMDEQQVYISTGLGGKNQQLRYFAVFIANEDNHSYTEIQQRLIKTELEFAIKKHKGIIEEISFNEDLAITVFLLPVKSDIQILFKNVIDEFNQYGNFVREDVIITNVKRMSVEEIRQFINRTK